MTLNQHRPGIGQYRELKQASICGPDLVVLHPVREGLWMELAGPCRAVSSGQARAGPLGRGSVLAEWLLAQAL